MPVLDDCEMNGIRYAHKVNGCRTTGGIMGLAATTYSGGTSGWSFTVDANDLIISASCNSVAVTGGSNTRLFYFQEQQPEKATFKIDGEEGDDKMTNGYVATGSIKFKKNDYLLRKKVIDLAETKTLAIIKDNSGNYVLVGEEYGCFFKPSHDWGTTFKDPNGATVTFSSSSTYSPRYISPTLAEMLFNYDTTLTA